MGLGPEEQPAKNTFREGRSVCVVILVAPCWMPVAAYILRALCSGVFLSGDCADPWGRAPQGRVRCLAPTDNAAQRRQGPRSTMPVCPHV